MPRKPAPTAPATAPTAPTAPTTLLSLSALASARITQWTYDAVLADDSAKAMVDVLFADGIRPHHTRDKECPEGSAERGIYLAITAAIRAGVVKRKPEWDASKVANDVSARRGNLRNALQRRCDAEKAAKAAADAAAAAAVNGEAPEPAEKTKRGFNCENFRESIATWIKRLSKDGVATDFSRDEVLAALKSLQVKATVTK